MVDLDLHLPPRISSVAKPDSRKPIVNVSPGAENGFVVGWVGHGHRPEGLPLGVNAEYGEELIQFDLEALQEANAELQSPSPGTAQYAGSLVLGQQIVAKIGDRQLPLRGWRALYFRPETAMDTNSQEFANTALATWLAFGSLQTVHRARLTRAQRAVAEVWPTRFGSVHSRAMNERAMNEIEDNATHLNLTFVDDPAAIPLFEQAARHMIYQDLGHRGGPPAGGTLEVELDLRLPEAGGAEHA